MVEQVNKEQPKEEQPYEKYKKMGLKEVIYWGKAKNLAIGNFIEEERYPDGKIKSRELSLKFTEHIRICDIRTGKGRKEVNFIEGSDTFENGFCRFVKDLAEARMLTQAQDAIKSVKNLTLTSEESIVLEEKGGEFVPVAGTATSSDTIK